MFQQILLPLGADQPKLDAPSVADLLAAEEDATVEFKSSARYSYREGVPEKVINHGVLKTIAAFLNTDGGTLAIGISDDQEILGIQPDLDMKRQDADHYINWLTTLVQHNLGTTAATKTRFRLEEVDGKTVCLADVERSPRPVYLQTKNEGELYVRLNNTTRALRPSEIHDYIRDRWDD